MNGRIALDRRSVPAFGIVFVKVSSQNVEHSQKQAFVRDAVQVIKLRDDPQLGTRMIESSVGRYPKWCLSIDASRRRRQPQHRGRVIDVWRFPVLLCSTEPS